MRKGEALSERRKRGTREVRRALLIEPLTATPISRDWLRRRAVGESL